MAQAFDPEVLHQVGKRAAGLEPEAVVQAVIDELKPLYPGHVETDHDWVFSLFGGTAGVMKVLHASLSEYVIVYGTPIGTGGFSGRYLLDIHDTVLSGEMLTYTLDRPLEPVHTRPGEQAFMPRLSAKGWSLAPGTWMLEHGRGPLLTALPMALGDALFGSMDPFTLASTLRIYGVGTARQLLRGKV